MQTSDTLIWLFAQQHGFIIVSKDADFHQLSLLFGHPLKLIFLRVGNCSTSRIVQLLRAHYIALSAFGVDQASSILVLP